MVGIIYYLLTNELPDCDIALFPWFYLAKKAVSGKNLNFENENWCQRLQSRLEQSVGDMDDDSGDNIFAWSNP